NCAAGHISNEIARLVGGHPGLFDSDFVLQNSSPQAVGEGLWAEYGVKWLFNWLAMELKLSGRLRWGDELHLLHLEPRRASLPSAERLQITAGRGLGLFAGGRVSQDALA